MDDLLAILLTLLSLSVVIRFFTQFPAPHSYVSGHASNPETPGDWPSDRELAFASLRGIQLDPTLRSLWGADEGPSSFSELLSSQDPDVRWAAVDAITLGMSLDDRERSHLMQRVLNSEEELCAMSRWQSKRNDVILCHQALWMHEPRHCSHCKSLSLTASVADHFQSLSQADLSSSSSAKRKEVVEEDMPDVSKGDGSKSSKRRKTKKGTKSSDMEMEMGMGGDCPLGLPAPAGGVDLLSNLPPSQGFVRVCGIDLPCSLSSTSTSTSTSTMKEGLTQPPFIHVDSAGKNLESCALAFCAGRPLLLEGPPGSGKTRLIDHLASLTGNYEQMVRIHLDDQMDAKSLVSAILHLFFLGL